MAASGLITVGNHAPVVIFSTSVNGQSPPAMLEAAGYTKWTFMIDGTFTGASATIVGTIDRNTSGYIGQRSAPTGTNWFTLSPVSGGGVNPLTSSTQQLQYNNPLIAVSVVVSGITAGTVIVLGYAVR